MTEAHTCLYSIPKTVRDVIYKLIKKQILIIMIKLMDKYQGFNDRKLFSTLALIKRKM